MQKSKGQALWDRAKKVIPGGNMLLSKRPEMFLPNQWPAYFESAKGCIIKDLDGRRLIDTCIMGIGTNTLGYGHGEVDEAVLKAIADGNMSTFNAPEEVYLAEKLVEIHPWADMVRFARTGGEANAIAIRIARAATSKDKVAFCGYHGWHDWYLSANLTDKNGLDYHLLPGLEAKGVPLGLKNHSFTFNYNDYEALETLLTEHEDIGVVIMEVKRNIEPISDFLHKVRKLTLKKGVLLIFDECTSGFRETQGGLHQAYGVSPDMAMFGKALGNGYAITAVIGRRETMEHAQGSFISSTFWTERIGSVAALKTLDVMQREKSWEKISKLGDYISATWAASAEKHSIPIEISGLRSIPAFNIRHKDTLKYKTYITQEMLKKGYLASNIIFCSLAHDDEIIEEYLFQLDKIFNKISNFMEGEDINIHIDGPVCHSGFRRLN